MNQVAPLSSSYGQLPDVIGAAGARASYRFIEFFTAQIRNPHTRPAYAQAARNFFGKRRILGRITIPHRPRANPGTVFANPPF